MTILIGYEAANSFVKATSTISNGTVDTYLNTLTEYKKKAATDSFSGAIKSDFYKIGDKYYRAGEELKKEGTKTSSGNNATRYRSAEFYRECMVAIFRQLEKETKKDVFNEDIYVVTGVPVKDDGTNEKDIYSQLLKNDGVHIVNNKSFKIKSVKVISQGLSAFYDEALDFDGDFVVKFVNEATGKEYLYSDIGYGTVDIQHISDLSPYTEEGMTGMIALFKEINEWAKANNSGYADDAVEDFALIESMKKGDVINVTANEVKVIEKDKFYQEYANSVITRMEKLKLTLHHKIKFTGGGAVALKAYLIQALRDKGYENVISRCEFNDGLAQSRNARGYFKFGMRFYRKQGVDI